MLPQEKTLGRHCTPGGIADADVQRRENVGAERSCKLQWAVAADVTRQESRGCEAIHSVPAATQRNLSSTKSSEVKALTDKFLQHSSQCKRLHSVKVCSFDCMETHGEDGHQSKAGKADTPSAQFACTWLALSNLMARHLRFILSFELSLRLPLRQTGPAKLQGNLTFCSAMRGRLARPLNA